MRGEPYFLCSLLSPFQNSSIALGALLGSLSSREATPSVTIVGAQFLDAQGDVPEESKVLSLRSPRLRETVTPALRNAGILGGLGATAGWVPTAPVTPAAQGM
jgi:hypothetical protein